MKRFFLACLTGLALSACQKAPNGAPVMGEADLDGRQAIGQVMHGGRGALVNKGGMVDARITMGTYNIGSSFPMQWSLKITSSMGVSLVRCVRLEKADVAAQIDPNTIQVDYRTFAAQDQVIVRFPANAQLYLNGTASTLPSNKTVPSALSVPLALTSNGVPGFFRFDEGLFNHNGIFTAWLIDRDPHDDPASCAN